MEEGSSGNYYVVPGDEHPAAPNDAPEEGGGNEGNNCDYVVLPVLIPTKAIGNFSSESLKDQEASGLPFVTLANTVLDTNQITADIGESQEEQEPGTPPNGNDDSAKRRKQSGPNEQESCEGRKRTRQNPSVGDRSCQEAASGSSDSTMRFLQIGQTTEGMVLLAVNDDGSPVDVEEVKRVVDSTIADSRATTSQQSTQELVNKDQGEPSVQAQPCHLASRLMDRANSSLSHSETVTFSGCQNPASGRELHQEGVYLQEHCPKTLTNSHHPPNPISPTIMLNSTPPPQDEHCVLIFQSHPYPSQRPPIEVKPLLPTTELLQAQPSPIVWKSPRGRPHPRSQILRSFEGVQERVAGLDHGYGRFRVDHRFGYGTRGCGPGALMPSISRSCVHGQLDMPAPLRNAHEPGNVAVGRVLAQPVNNSGQLYVAGRHKRPGDGGYSLNTNKKHRKVHVGKVIGMPGW